MVIDAKSRNETLIAWTVLRVALILAACGWIYGPVYHGDWFMDDQFYLSKNPLMDDPARVWKAWFDPGSWIEYYPITETVQWCQWQLWREQTLGYHLVNVVLHGLNALLVWRLLGRFGLSWAWLGGLIFAVHPVAVESVAAIAELKNTLSLAPLLCAMTAWIDYERDGRRRDYVLALALFVTAMLCKVAVVMFPLVILVYAWWKRGRLCWRDLVESVPFFAVSLALGLMAVWTGSNYETVNDLAETEVPQLSVPARLAEGGLAGAFYFAQFFLPVGLLPIYPQWKVDPPTAAQFLPWLALAVALLFLWRHRLRWGRHALLGLGFFFINLAPVLGFRTISFMKFAWVMDHFLYLPMIGLIGLVVAGAKQIAASKAGKTWVPVLTVLVLGTLAWGSRDYAGKFADGTSLWTYTLERNPQAWPAYNDLGVAFFDKGQVDAAIAEYKKALQLKPRWAEAHDNLGLALFRVGKKEDAVGQFEQAVALKPGDAMLRNNLGYALSQTGRVAEAIEQYELVLQRRPSYAKAQKFLADALMQVGREAEAREHYEEALRINPDYAAARIRLEMLDKIP